MKRECWIDFAKLFACFLIVTRHLVTGLTKANLTSEIDEIYSIFDSITHLFRVPLFLFCSGYLYQKLSLVNDLKSYWNNISKKFINLGVLYFTFSGITILLRYVFSGYVNNPFESNAFNTLIFHPIGQYWFLYSLFFIFLFCPTVQSAKEAYCLLVISLLLKILIISDIRLPYPLSYTQRDLIWFAFGIIFVKFNLTKFFCWKFVLVSALYLPISILVISQGQLNNAIKPLLIFLGILMTISFFFVISKQSWFPSEIMVSFSKYTMHIYVLHTITNATFRAILSKMDIHSIIIHIIVGFFSSIAIPITIAYFCQKFALLNFFFEPVKMINKFKNSIKMRKN